ncbi:MAG: DUF2934 domain-containing protein [Acidobacteria bacterium]|nr:MAG: DUF2934 domain-containing protein [Acidobacteriota bacterium]RPJ74694.1 MAG: DUF2934 domain-containing protein [Acidobacteriota bacterium]
MATVTAPVDLVPMTPGHQALQAMTQSNLREAVAANGPSLEQIERRAYQIYLQRGGQDGRDLEDWLEAERQLRGH